MWSDERFAKYKGILFDVDGTLTSGTLILGTEGEAYKIFHAQDGMALGLAHRMGYITGFITGRTSDIVRVRAEELKVDVLLMGVKNKVQAVAAALEKYRLCWEEVAFMGDDLNDLPLFDKVGIAGSPSNGAPENLKRRNLFPAVPGEVEQRESLLRKYSRNRDGGMKRLRHFIRKCKRHLPGNSYII